MWGLAFKLTFLSGITKLLSGDETWWGLTALRYHYETQPIPTWVAWYAHQAPAWIATLSTVVMFAIELAVPFVILLPPRFRRVRVTGVALLCLLQALIALTGNYGFFNLLAVVLYLALLDDATLGRVLPGLGAPGPGPSPSAPVVSPRLRRRRAALGAVAATMGLLSTYTLVREIRRPDPMPEWSAELFGWVAPFRSVNGYGLFRTMTIERPEIVVEGSADGVAWTEYPFRWKAGDLRRAPGFVQPHMPRLDWQMWFAALGPRAEAHWLLPLAQHLLEESPAVLALLDDANPFAGEPPRFVRLVLYDYRFATPAEDGAWWRRELIAYLTEPIGRDDVR